MAQQTRAITADELWRMPDDGYHRYELDRGQLLVMAPAGGLHGVVVSRLNAALATHVDAARLGVVMTADTGFTPESDPDTVRAPDRPPQVLHESDTLDGGELLPGFRYPLSKLFTVDL
jgi:Uma2 family endonuclease